MESGGGACRTTAAAVASAKAAATAEMKKKRNKNGGEGSRPPSSAPAGRHRQRLPARQKAMATAWMQAAMPTQPLISSARRASEKAWTSRAASTPTAYARSTPQTPAPNSRHATGKRPGAFPPAIIKTPAPSRIHNSGSCHADRENCISSGAPTTNTFHAASKASRETPVFTHIPVFVPDFIQKRATARTAGRTAHQNQAVPASTNIHGTGNP